MSVCLCHKVLISTVSFSTGKLRFRLMERKGVPASSSSGYLYAQSSDGGVSY